MEQQHITYPLLCAAELAELEAEVNNVCLAETDPDILLCQQLSDEEIARIRSAADERDRLSFNDLPGVKLLARSKDLLNTTRHESASICQGIEEAVTQCDDSLQIEATHREEQTYSQEENESCAHKDTTTNRLETFDDSISPNASNFATTSNGKVDKGTDANAYQIELFHSSLSSYTLLTGQSTISRNIMAPNAEIAGANVGRSDKEFKHAQGIAEFDVHLSFDMLIAKAHYEHSYRRAVINEKRIRHLELKKQRHLEHKKQRETRRLNRMARRLQRCAKRFISSRRFFCEKIQALFRIVMTRWIGLALDLCIEFIKTRRKLESDLTRFCRYCGVRRTSSHSGDLGRSVLDILVQMQVRPLHMTALFRSGNMYVFSRRLSKRILGSDVVPFASVQYVSCPASKFFHVWLRFDDRHWGHSSGSKIMVSIRARKAQFVAAIEMMKCEQIDYNARPKLLPPKQSYVVFSQFVQLLPMKRALRNIVEHKGQFNAAVRIQRTYRGFFIRRTFYALVTLTQAILKIIYHHIFAMLYRFVRSRQFHASQTIQKTYRGFATRKRFRHFHKISFDYVDSDVEWLLSGDIDNLLNFGFHNEDTGVWEPCKPLISTQGNNCNDFVIDIVASTLRKEAGKQFNEAVEKTTIQTFPTISPNSMDEFSTTHDKERNGITSQWNISNERVARVSNVVYRIQSMMSKSINNSFSLFPQTLWSQQAMIKKRLQMKRVGSSGLAMKLRKGRC
ncbi:hypothetical protein HJC23_008073 [Cyclotella cryptica]|uniref:Uncharacterized protein n=1 Tax=Cyclotella cryptica TaxID=29204 RepID=A0ABD3P118_9STRA